MVKKYFDSSDFFDPTVVESIVSSIEQHDGDEVFFGGRLSDDQSKVVSVEVIARGNENQVPSPVDVAASYPVVIHNHPSSVIRASDADLQVAAMLQNYGCGFFIVDNHCTRVNVIAPWRIKKIKQIDVNRVKAYFEEQQSDDTYQRRDQQIEMALSIAETFNNSNIYVCEAPTGTGKSMAYLINAVLWATGNQEKVVVSTNTIALQEQLFHKDIPEIKKRLGVEFSYTLVKGKGNFLCLQRLEQLSQSPHLSFMEELDENALGSLATWSKQTQTGDRNDYPMEFKSSLWEEVCVDGELCRPSKCPFANRCFYLKQREKTFTSDLLVVNHHLLCADAVVKEKISPSSPFNILPDYHYLIIDEAHNLESVATQHFGDSLNTGSIRYTYNLLSREDKKRITRGLLREILDKAKGRLTKNEFKELNDRVNAFVHLKKYYEGLLPLYESIEAFIGEKDANSKNNKSSEKSLRFKGDFADNLEWQARYQEPALKILDALEKSFASLLKIKDFFEQHPLSELDYDLHTLDVYTQRFGASMSVIRASFDDTEKEDVKWITCDRTAADRLRLSINILPLVIGQRLNEKLFQQKKGVILTSATLYSGDQFAYFLDSIGLKEESRLKTRRFQSSFNYQEQCKMFIPKDISLVTDRSFNEDVAKYVSILSIFHQGSTLVLFTSFSQLEAVYLLIKDALLSRGIEVIKQGSGSKHQLIQWFKEQKKVLLGVNSFWEGVDLKGDLLKCLIIPKLPFSVPTEPYYEAKVEYLEKQNVNSFKEYSVPQAVMRFKQGFGRLIRTHEDRGLFCVLDRRIVTKSYGAMFREALPEMPVYDHLDFLNDHTP